MDDPWTSYKERYHEFPGNIMKYYEPKMFYNYVDDTWEEYPFSPWTNFKENMTDIISAIRNLPTAVDNFFWYFRGYKEFKMVIKYLYNKLSEPIVDTVLYNRFKVIVENLYERLLEFVKYAPDTELYKGFKVIVENLYERLLEFVKYAPDTELYKGFKVILETLYERLLEFVSYVTDTLIYKHFKSILGDLYELLLEFDKVIQEVFPDRFYEIYPQLALYITCTAILVYWIYIPDVRLYQLWRTSPPYLKKSGIPRSQW